MAKSDTIERGKVRPAAVAGRFYPRDPTELRNLINMLLAQVPPATGPGPKALIAPHAGYLYSGPIAASAYAQLLPARDQIQRIVLLGPSHYVAVKGLATSSARSLCHAAGGRAGGCRSRPPGPDAAASPGVGRGPRTGTLLEVQLPFLQTVLGDFALVPLAVGDATPEEVSEVLDALWGGPETRFVISSDLSHYYDFQTAQRLDKATAKAIEALKPGGVGEERACGRIPIRGLLQAARRHGLRARTVDLRSSGDTAGPRDKVVGYGAFVFEEE